MSDSVEAIIAGHELAGNPNFRQWVSAGLRSLGPEADRQRVLEFAEAGWQATASQAEADRKRAKPFIAEERRRIRSIIYSRAGQDRPQAACFLAFETDIDAATAIISLEALAASGADGRLS